LAFVPQPKQWEYDTPEAMQRALAGNWSRDVYLQHRVELAEGLAALLGLDGTQRGFEIGSGEGLVARALSAHCESLDCTDISRTFLEAAEETCRDCENVQFHLIEREFLDFLPARQYDFGYSSNVFVHLNAYDIYFYLRSVHELLRSGEGSSSTSRRSATPPARCSIPRRWSTGAIRIRSALAGS
jgi:SAM-dependent methyltransferase